MAYIYTYGIKNMRDDVEIMVGGDWNIYIYVYVCMCGLALE